MDFQAITRYIKESGATNHRFIPSRLLIPEERIRSYCYEDKCGCYNKHLMCPPNTETVSEIRRKLKSFKTGILLQYTDNVNVRDDNEGLKKTKLKLHHIVLEIEKYLKENMGPEYLLGMIGGSCELCDECAGYRNEPCVFPEKARTSMEALAIDVIGLLRKLKLDSEFYSDRITWTGLVLIDREFGNK